MNIAGKGPDALTQQVFISYAKEDKEIADKIYDTLKAKGIPCWVAHRDIAAGQNWPDAISKAISNSRVMIVVLSEHTQKSLYVGREVYQAIDENLIVIPFCIEKVFLSGGLKLLLSHCQWINAYPNPLEKNMDVLAETLQRHLGIELDQCLLDIGADFIRYFKSKGWDIKKNENDYWEAFYMDYDITMIYIPPGKFIMGADDGGGNEEPAHEVSLDGYWIGKYEVTFAQYDQYCDETGKKKPDDGGMGRGNRPVVRVSWYDAVAYCDWLSQETGLEFDLPTEAEWEKAARGTEGLIYPWGNEFDKNKCNSSESGLRRTTPVGTYPSGKSPYGCMDMVGNVLEWCVDWFDSQYYKRKPAKHPKGPLEWRADWREGESYKKNPVKNPQGPMEGALRAKRGGGYFFEATYCRASCRFEGLPFPSDFQVGFRLVMII